MFSITLLNKTTSHSFSGQGLCHRDAVCWFTECLLISPYTETAVAAAVTRLKEGCVFSLLFRLQSWGLRNASEEWKILPYLCESVGCWIFCLAVKRANQDKCVFSVTKWTMVINGRFTPSVLPPFPLNAILVQLHLHHYFICHWYGFFLEAEILLTGLLKLRLWYHSGKKIRSDSFASRVKPRDRLESSGFFLIFVNIRLTVSPWEVSCFLCA